MALSYVKTNCWSLRFRLIRPLACGVRYRTLVGYGSSRSKDKLDFDNQTPSNHRHSGIVVHPDSIGAQILPGGAMVNRTTRSGQVQTRYTELVHGYFWMLKDLKKTEEKPTLANTTALIPENEAKVFPMLSALQSLSTGDRVDLPAFALRKNRSRDAAAQSCLVAICFRDFGFQQLSSWINPFRAAFAQNDRVEVITVNVAEGWFNQYILQPIITASTKRNTKPEELDSTFLYFGKTDNLRDSLRMHNILVGYVFLLDGHGRVRFAGSGVASDAEVERLLKWTKEMTQDSKAFSFQKAAGRAHVRPQLQNRLHRR